MRPANLSIARIRGVREAATVTMALPVGALLAASAQTSTAGRASPHGTRLTILCTRPGIPINPEKE
jgi:hypothetical protein